MQNKANFRKAKMNVNPVESTDYKNETALRVRKNKAKQSQFQNRQNERKLYYNNELCKKTTLQTRAKQTQNKANSKPIQAKTNPKQSQNKANFKIGKMNLSIAVTKDYEEKCG